MHRRTDCMTDGVKPHAIMRQCLHLAPMPLRCSWLDTIKALRGPVPVAV